MLPRFPLFPTMAICLLAGILALAACAEKQPPTERGPLKVVVTIPPLAGLVRPLLPPDAEVTVLMPPGRSEHGYEFTAADLAKITKADVLVYVGLGLEPKIADFARRRNNPNRTDIVFERVLHLPAPSGHEGHGHEEHAEEGHEHHDEEPAGGHDGHDHGPVDPHLWLDPVLVERFVMLASSGIHDAQLRAGLRTAEEQTRLSQATADLVARVHELHEEAERKLAPVHGQPIVTHHAAWGRLAERYGLRIAAVIRTIETAEPTSAAVAQAVDAIRSQNVTTIFVEPQFSRAAADKIAKATGVRVAPLDPIGDGDWFKMMRANIDALAASAAPSPASPATPPEKGP